MQLAFRTEPKLGRFVVQLQNKKIRKIPYISFLRISLSDPVGIQTQDLQNRNLTLYSAKLRDHLLISECKGSVLIQERRIKF